MADYKNKKKFVRKSETPAGRVVHSEANPINFREEHPSWNFAACDNSFWPFSEKSAGSLFWTEILPFLQALEKLTWQEILNYSNNKHHLIALDSLNKNARDRLYQLRIEAEAVMSLRVSGSHRLYGYLEGSVFHLLWFDTNHGDNGACVCRSRKKHT